MAETPPNREGTFAIIAIILAVGLVTAILLIDFAIVWTVITHGASAIPDYFGQILVGALGGIVGLLGGFMGVRIWRGSGNQQDQSEQPTAMLPRVEQPPEERRD